MSESINIGARLELFVDDLLIEEMHGARFELQRPERREVAFCADAAWEDEITAFRSVADDRGTVRLFYVARRPDRSNEAYAAFALAESTDGGKSFERPNLGLTEFEGSKDNNILCLAEPPFSPPPAFIDTNPDCKPEERYKGLSARWQELYAMCSADGLHWRPMSEEPLRMDGTFDTVNTAFWDSRTECYRCYTRYFENLGAGTTEADVLGPKPTVVRAIQSSTSSDFLNWTPVVHNQYGDPYDDIQLYTNAVVPCPDAEHIYLSFPNRYVQDRICDPSHPHPGVNDALFMASRDGVNWKRYPEAWVRPGLDELNWTERNNYPTWGLIRTSPTEWSMYISEHYRHPGTPVQLRRLSIRPHGFVSIRADFGGGEFVTKPVVFGGEELYLNYSTSAAGSAQIEVQDPERKPLPGLGLADMDPLFGDELDACVRWRETESLADLAGRPIRIRFVLKDADVFALRFG